MRTCCSKDGDERRGGGGYCDTEGEKRMIDKLKLVELLRGKKRKFVTSYQASCYWFAYRLPFPFYSFALLVVSDIFFKCQHI